jgi:recombination protein RecR
MSVYYGDKMAKLMEEFTKLPGIGVKSAQRLAFYIISQSLDRVVEFASAIEQAKRNIMFCSICQNISDSDPCMFCSDPERDGSMIMVVEDPRAMAAYEKTREYRGLYHVLHGTISPINGIGPNDLKIKELLQRLGDTGPFEIILATNPNVEGEATALYLGRLLKPFNIKITRIAHGVPIGGELEHIDEITLSRALQGRMEI